MVGSHPLPQLCAKHCRIFSSHASKTIPRHQKSQRHRNVSETTIPGPPSHGQEMTGPKPHGRFPNLAMSSHGIQQNYILDNYDKHSGKGEKKFYKLKPCVLKHMDDHIVGSHPLPQPCTKHCSVFSSHLSETIPRRPKSQWL